MTATLAPSAPETASAGSGRGTIFALCAAVAVLEGFDLQVIGVAAPQLVRALGLGPEAIGIAFSASLVGLALGAIVGGRLADRLGRKPVLLLAVAMFGGLTVLTAASTGLSMLVILRFLTGLGLGGSMPNIIAIVSETARRERATLAVAAMACGLSAGGVIAAQIARVLPAGTGWGALFLIGGALPLLLLPLLWFGLPETYAGRANAVERAGFGEALFGEGRTAMTVALWCVFALTLLQLSLLLNWLPSLTIAKGFSREQGFLAATVFNLGGIAGSLAIGWAVDRFGARWPMLIVYIAMAASLGGLAAARGFDALLAASFAGGFMVLGAQFALYGINPRLYTDATRGTGVGVAVAIGRIGAILGPVIAGVMIGRGLSADAVVWRQIPLVLLALVAMAVLARAGRDRLTRPH